MKESPHPWKNPHTLLCVAQFLPWSSARFSVSATSTFAKEDPSCSEESNFLTQPLMHPLVPYHLQTCPVFILPSPGSPGSFSASSSVLATSRSSKEDSSIQYFGSSPLCFLYLFLPWLLPARQSHGLDATPLTNSFIHSFIN